MIQRADYDDTALGDGEVAQHVHEGNVDLEQLAALYTEDDRARLVPGWEDRWEILVTEKKKFSPVPPVVLLRFQGQQWVRLVAADARPVVPAKLMISSFESSTSTDIWVRKSFLGKKSPHSKQSAVGLLPMASC